MDNRPWPTFDDPDAQPRSFLEVAARGSPFPAPVTCLPRSARLFFPRAPHLSPVCSTRPSNCSISASLHRTRLPHYVSALLRPRQVREGRRGGGVFTGSWSLGVRLKTDVFQYI